MSATTGSRGLYTGRAEGDRENQVREFVTRGVSRQFAEALTNLLQLHSLEAYLAGNGCEGTVWRVQYQRHAFKMNYCTVLGDWTRLAAWVETCKEVEARYGHKP